MKPRRRFYVLPFLLSLFLFNCQNRSETDDVRSLLGTTISQNALDDFIALQMESLDMPALSIAIINDGKVVYHRIKGYGDKEKLTPVTDQSIFEGASISKSVFGYFAMTFVEDGLLDLDKPLYLYLPNPDIEHDDRYKKITARIVLSHRSGFPNWRDDHPGKKLFIQFDPGTDYHYSGEGYQYLAEVLKHILQTNWAGLEAEFQRRVATPFKMNHTKFIKDDYIREHKVQPYDEEGNWIDLYADEWWRVRDSVFVAPTTIHSEAIDFSKWMVAMMNQEGLTESGFAELFKGHSEINTGILTEEYTLGFVKVSLLNLIELFAHNGNNSGFTSNFMFNKDKKWGFVMFTNCKAGDEFSLNILSNLLFIGPKGKQLSIGLTFLFSLLLLIPNLVLLFFKNPSAARIRKNNLFIGILGVFGTITALILLLASTSMLVKILVLLLLLVSLTLGHKTWNIAQAHWKAHKNMRIEMVFQICILVGVLVSGLAACIS